MRKRFYSRTYLTCIILTVLAFSCGKDDDGDIPPKTNMAPEINSQSFNASEAIDDTTVIGQVVATDKDGDDLAFSIKTNSNALFEMTDKGDLKLASGKALDFETSTKHELSIDVTDGEATTNATVTINVIDVNENQAPVFNDQTFTAQENVTARGQLVATIMATDPDDDDITFAWAPGSNVTAFQLSMDTGEIRTVNNGQGDLDFETTSSYVLPVLASDGVLTTQANITINVNDSNDAPEANNQTFTVAEDIDDTVLIGQLAATDQDGDALTFSVDIDYESLFDLSSSGEIRLRSGSSLDFENKTAHQLDVFISDGTETIQRTITIEVTDVNEGNNAVSIFAGTLEIAGNSNGNGTAARFSTPRGMIVVSNGNLLVVDAGNDAIRSISPSGSVQTIIQNASFGSLRDIVADNAGNLYVSDQTRHVIWKIDAIDTGMGPQVFAGGLDSDGFVNSTVGTSARFNRPSGLAIDVNDNIYVADSNNGTVRKITPGGVVTSHFSPLTSAAPEGIALTPGGTVYFTDYNSNLVGVVSSNGNVSFPMGIGSSNGGFRDGVNGSGSAGARLEGPTDLIIVGTDIYLVSNRNNALRRIDTATPSGSNTIETIASAVVPANYTGTGLQTTAFKNPIGIAVGAAGNIYVSDTNNHVIRKIVISN